MARTPAESRDPNLWPAERRLRLVQDLVQGRDTVASLARRHGLPVQTLLDWRDQHLRQRGGQGRSARRDGLQAPGVDSAQSRLTGAC